MASGSRTGTYPPPVVNFDCVTCVCLIVVDMQCLQYVRNGHQYNPQTPRIVGPTTPRRDLAPMFEIPGSATVYMCIAKWLEYPYGPCVASIKISTKVKQNELFRLFSV